MRFPRAPDRSTVVFVPRLFVAWPWRAAPLLLALACGASRPQRPDGGADASPDIGPASLDGALGARADEVIAAIVAGDADLLRDRPALAAGKYVRMASDAFAYFRGSLALYLADWNRADSPLRATAFPAGDARPLGLGDPHPENFGTMRTSAGMLRLEPNDFDTADRVPYLWDVRRFGVGMCLAARLTNPTDDAARTVTAAAAPEVVRATVAAYADAIRALAAGGARPAVESGGGNPVLDELFARAADDGDDRAELDELTEVKGGVRRLRRGVIDKAQPWVALRALPARSRLGLASTVARYRDTLPAPPPVSALCALDAVQEVGQGIGSYPRARALVLTRGASTDGDDDVLLEVKELPAQSALPLPGPSGFPSPEARLLAALAAGFTEPGADPRWGVGTWDGPDFVVQVRTRAADFKTLRVHNLVGPLGTPAAVSGLGAALAPLLARMHAAPVDGASPAEPIADAIAADPTAFVEEQTAAALTYCDQALADWVLFQQSLLLLGPTLGVVGDPAGVASAERRVLFDPEADPAAAGVDPVVGPLTLNEIAAESNEYVELVNGSAVEQPLGGFSIADQDSDGGPRLAEAAPFAAGATLAPGARVVTVGGFMTPAAGPQTTCVPTLASCYQAAWDISGSNGETVFLLSPEGVILDEVSCPRGGLAAGKSWSRLPDGSGPFAAAAASPGQRNAGP
jgi:hypothetical protein